MKRREFIQVIAGVAAAWSATAGAQKGKLPTIGFLGANTREVQKLWTAAFVQRLGELGWIEGRTVAIEFRWSEGHFERSPQFFAEFIRLKVDVIVTHNTQNVIAAERATSIIPIVFATLPDPVGNNIVASLAHPGGNVTGLSNEAPDMVGKRLGLLRDVNPTLRRLGILANASNPAAPLETDKLEVAARTLGLEVATPDIWRAEDIPPAIEALKGRAEAIYIQTDSLFNHNRVQTNVLLLAARLPSVISFQEFVDAGGLMSYGPNLPDLFRRAAELVDKILRGTKPGDIPVEQPTKFDLVINLKTAKTLGLQIPDKLISIANYVIE